MPWHTGGEVTPNKVRAMELQRLLNFYHKNYFENQLLRNLYEYKLGGIYFGTHKSI